jgi:hypothetical protein
MGTRDNAKADNNIQLQNGERMREEWEGVEDSLTDKSKRYFQWWEMKERHEKELAKLQTEQAKAVISLVAQHMAERDELKKGNQ